MIIPPFTGVKLVEFSDRLELCPVGWYRDRIGLGKFKANKVGFEPGEEWFEKWRRIMGDNEIWVVVSWKVFDGQSEKVDYVINCLPGTTLEAAQGVFEALKDYLEASPPDRDTRPGVEKLLSQIKHLAPSGLWITHDSGGESRGQVSDAGAIIHSYSDQKTNETKEMYQARLKALAGMQPETVAMIQKSEEAKDESERQKLEREAVQAFFAEVASYWTEETLMAWQRNNPVGSKWLCQFARMVNEPEGQLDPVNHELALHWLRRGYNLMTEKELSDAILKATGKYIKPNTLKKKRGKLGLSTKRPFGPWPKWKWKL